MENHEIQCKYKCEISGTSWVKKGAKRKLDYIDLILTVIISKTFQIQNSRNNKKALGF